VNRSFPNQLLTQEHQQRDLELGKYIAN